MAWNDDRNRVGADCLAYRARHIRPPYITSHLPIGRDVPVVDLNQPRVYFVLERGRHPGEVERKVEGLSLSVEVFLKLPNGLGQLFRPFLERVGMVVFGKRTKFEMTYSGA